MRILQVINSLQMGGAERLISDIVPRLCKMGHEVDVLVFDGTETPFMKSLKNSNVRVIALGDGSRSPYSLVYLLKLLPIIRKYDIVHSHTTPAQLFCSFASFFCGAPILVTTEHSTYNHRRGKWLFKCLDMMMYKAYAKIISIGQMPKENLEKQIGNLGDKAIVIENGIDIDSFVKAIPLGRDEILCSNDDFILTMVGRFTDAKDQETLIRSLPLLPDNCKLVLVGDGPRKELMSHYAESIRVIERVKFLGLRNDVPSIIKASDVVILSSHWEGFGLAAVEGMAAQKPVIATNVPGLREVVDGAGLLFNVGDVESLAQIVMKLKDDYGFYSRISKQCFERAQTFDIDKVAQRYGSVYRQLIY